MSRAWDELSHSSFCLGSKGTENSTTGEKAKPAQGSPIELVTAVGNWRYLRYSKGFIHLCPSLTGQGWLRGVTSSFLQVCQCAQMAVRFPAGVIHSSSRDVLAKSKIYSLQLRWGAVRLHLPGVSCHSNTGVKRGQRGCETGHKRRLIYTAWVQGHVYFTFACNQWKSPPNSRVDWHPEFCCKFYLFVFTSIVLERGKTLLQRVLFLFV